MLCAEFSPRSPWASMKSRKYDWDTWQEHTNSLSHTTGIYLFFHLLINSSFLSLLKQVYEIFISFWPRTSYLNQVESYLVLSLFFFMTLDSFFINFYDYWNIFFSNGSKGSTSIIWKNKWKRNWWGQLITYYQKEQKRRNERRKKERKKEERKEKKEKGAWMDKVERVKPLWISVGGEGEGENWFFAIKSCRMTKKRFFLF